MDAERRASWRYIGILVLGALFAGCARVPLGPVLLPDEEKQKVISLINFGSDTTPLALLTERFGENGVVVTPLSRYGAHLVTAIDGHSGNWVFEINGARKDTPKDSVDATNVPFGSTIVFKTVTTY